MTTVTSQHIDSVYDAITMMRIASQILSEGEVTDTMAGEISWMLGSCKTRLEPVINLLEEMESERNQEAKDGAIEAEINLLSEIMAVTTKFNRRRQKLEGRV